MQARISRINLAMTALMLAVENQSRPDQQPIEDTTITGEL